MALSMPPAANRPQPVAMAQSTSTSAIATPAILAAAGTEHRANGEFVAAVQRSRDEQVGDVDRGEREHETGGREDEQKERRGELVLLALKRHEFEAAAAIGCGVSRRQRVRERCQLTRAVRGRRAVREASHRQTRCAARSPASDGENTSGVHASMPGG